MSSFAANQLPISILFALLAASCATSRPSADGEAVATGGAVQLANALRDADRALSESGLSTTTVSYRVTRKSRMKSTTVVILMPQRALDLQELVAAGATRSLARRVFSQLGYVGVERGGLLVVSHDDDRLSFTSAWRSHAFVDEILVIESTGPDPVRLLVERVSGEDRVRVRADPRRSASD